MTQHASALPEWEELPDFGLYMDQMVTCAARVYQGCGTPCVLTPGMINSYVKNRLMDRPNGKKYSREALAQLLMICFLKQTASMDDMQRLLHPRDGEDTRSLYTRFRSGMGRLRTELTESSRPGALDCALAAAVYQQACRERLGEEDAAEDGGE